MMITFPVHPCGEFSARLDTVGTDEAEIVAIVPQDTVARRMRLDAIYFNACDACHVLMATVPAGSA